jgi:outer membrane protein assembly factor BamE (lipoprotein component of BamABCDE complex)
MLFAKTTKLKSRTLGSPKIEDDSVNVRWDYVKEKKQRNSIFFLNSR